MRGKYAIKLLFCKILCFLASREDEHFLTKGDSTVVKIAFFISMRKFFNARLVSEP